MAGGPKPGPWKSVDPPGQPIYGWGDRHRNGDGNRTARTNGNKSTMIQKKICMLGSFAVGKTSLVQRYVKGMFSEKYLTTVGVKIDKKSLTVGGHRVNLLLWDLAGEDAFQRVQRSYLRGSSGYFLVVDGTRKETLETALVLHQRAQETLGPVPFVLLVNKSDLSHDWELEAAQIENLKTWGWSVLYTSAKTDENVEAAFEQLAAAMLDAPPPTP